MTLISFIFLSCRYKTYLQNYLNMLRTLLVLCAICIAQLTFATRIDSLATRLKTDREDTIKVIHLYELTAEYYMIGDFEKGLTYGKEAIQLARELNFKRGLAQTQSNMGNIYLGQGDYSKAYEMYQAALKNDTEINNKEGIAKRYGNIGIVYYQQGDYPKAIDYYIKAMKIGEEIGDKNRVAVQQGNIGSIYFEQADYPKALDYYFKALKTCEELGDKNRMSIWLGNIGSVYYAQANYDKALEYYNKRLKMDEESGIKNYMAINLGNIGIIYYDQKDYPKALEYYLKALKIGEELGDQSRIGTLLGNIGLLYTKSGKFSEAEIYLKKAIAITRTIGARNDLRKFEEMLSELYTATGRYQLALEHYKIATKLKDSLFNEEKAKEITRKQLNFEFEQKEIARKNEEAKKDLIVKYEKEINEAVHKEQIIREKIQGWSIAGGITLVLLSVILFINRARLKQKNRYQEELNLLQKEKAMAVFEVQEQERKRIAEDLHDSLGHLLSTAKMNLQGNHAKEQIEASVQLLNQASEELRNISYNLMPSVLEEEGLTPALNELAQKSGKSGKMAVTFQAHDIQSLKFDKLAQFNIYRIVQEAINNIMKHAGASEAGIQLIGKGNNLTIMIEDNGKGFDSKNILSGRGQRNMRARTNWLNGNFHLDSTPGHGTTICIDIPN